MIEINSEKVDIIKEQIDVSYTDAKEALETSGGNMENALTYLEQKKKSHMNDV